MQNEQALSEMEMYISKFPDNILEAIEIGKKAEARLKVFPIKNMVMAGLGGSGIGAKFVSDLVWDTARIPIELVNDYCIPNWVDRDTLFVATSYSGNTEETLNALSEAVQAHAHIACITSGGNLQMLARERNYGLFEIPGGQPPRTSFGYNSVQQLFLFHAYDLIDGTFVKDLEEAADLLTRQSGAIRAEAAAIANKIKNTIPVIYAETRSEGIAVRLRQQINENAKTLCWHHVLPEMNHNELVGWAGGSNALSVLMIHNPDGFTSTAKRMELSKEIVSRYTDTVIDLRPKGTSKIARAYYLIHLADWISYYLAEEHGADPIEIDVIDFLKGKLAKK